MKIIVVHPSENVIANAAHLHLRAVQVSLPLVTPQGNIRHFVQRDVMVV